MIDAEEGLTKGSEVVSPTTLEGNLSPVRDPSLEGHVGSHVSQVEKEEEQQEQIE